MAIRPYWDTPYVRRDACVPLRLTPHISLYYIHNYRQKVHRYQSCQ